MKINSKIMKEVHKRVRLAKMENNKIDYRFQLSLEMKNIIEEIKEYRKALELANNHIGQYIDHNNSIVGQEREGLLKLINYQYGIDIDTDKLIRKNDFARKLAKSYTEKVLNYIEDDLTYIISRINRYNVL